MKLGRDLINDCSVVCDLRITHTLPCRNCIYKGKVCDAIKHKFKCDRPYELLDKNEFNERLGYYYD